MLTDEQIKATELVLRGAMARLIAEVDSVRLDITFDMLASCINDLLSDRAELQKQLAEATDIIKAAYGWGISDEYNEVMKKLIASETEVARLQEQVKSYIDTFGHKGLYLPDPFMHKHYLCNECGLTATDPIHNKE